MVLALDMILPIAHVANMRYIYHSKQAQIDKDIPGENYTRNDHYYMFGDKVLVKNILDMKHHFKVHTKLFKCG